MKIAIKVINKKGMDADDLQNIFNEVEIMQKVDHPNIVKYYETYDDKKYIYLCMELCTGGELFQKVLDSGKPFSEAEAATTFWKLLKALHHCHADNIVHRDIKPENIMYSAHGEAKLIDFGFAIKVRKARDEMDIAGTPYYIAPEVLTGKYGKQCDIWSLGVCIYQLLTGDMPFDGNSQAEVFGKIRAGDFEMPRRLSHDCKDLISQMLKVDPAMRIDTARALDHPWIKKGE